MFAALGVKVTVVEKRPRLLDFCDVADHGGAPVPPARPRRDLPARRGGDRRRPPRRHRASRISRAASASRPTSCCTPRDGRGETEDLALENAGLEADERGRIAVGPDYRTAVEHIFAAGDVIGWPALAATSMEQGRLAAAHAFGEEAQMSELLPVGIYTIPEISYVGRTRGGAHRGGDPVRGRHLPLSRARARAHPRRHVRAAEAPRLARGPQAPRRPRRSARTRPRSSTSARW